MSLGGFVGKFKLEVLEKSTKVARASFLEVLTNVIVATPVDEGIARGGWRATIDQPSADSGASVEGQADNKDPTGEATIQAVSDTLKTMEVGKDFTMYMTNNLPYIERLEYDGWSDQAPDGMVRVNVANFVDVVELKSKSIK